MKRWLFLIVLAIALGLILHVTSGQTASTVPWRTTDYAEDEATGHTYNQWKAWRGAFESLARQNGLRNADQCTPYQIGGARHPERLRDYYLRGVTPEKAFEDIGCDCEVFEHVWMKRLRELAKQRHIAIDPMDNEAFEEWLWLEYFLEGKSPDEAVNAVARSGYMKGRK